MRYEMRGYLFDKQSEESLPILSEIIVSGYDKAFDLIKGAGYEYYIFTLDKISEKYMFFAIFQIASWAKV